jgi:type II secretory pathway pseudopilin PulG
MLNSRPRKFGNYRIPIADWRLKIENKLNAKPAFSLIESLTALIILALISSSVLVVINRSIASAADSALSMQAFEVARENMEALLSKDSVSEIVEYGSSDKYPQIQWQTTVEAFYEPITSRMWIQAVCSAEYTDTAVELQTVELTHWLTDLTKEQLIRLMQEKLQELTAEQLIEIAEDAAEYAEVDVETIQRWVDNGMLITEEGYYIKSELELYKETDGRPTAEDRRRQAERLAEPDEPDEPDDKPDEPEKPDEPDKQDHSDIICGYTLQELMQMSLDELYQVLSNCDKF